MYTVTFPAYQALFMFLPSRMVSRHRSIPPLQQKHIPSDGFILKNGGTAERLGPNNPNQHRVLLISLLCYPSGWPFLCVCVCVCVWKNGLVPHNRPPPPFPTYLNQKEITTIQDGRTTWDSSCSFYYSPPLATCAFCGCEQRCKMLMMMMLMMLMGDRSRDERGMIWWPTSCVCVRLMPLTVVCVCVWVCPCLH